MKWRSILVLTVVLSVVGLCECAFAELSGPDPLLSIPEGLTAQRGTTVTVPILIDDATSLIAAEIYLDYDTDVFDLTNTDVKVGDLTVGWALIAHTVPGYSITVFGFEPLSGGSGSVLEIDFSVLPVAPLGPTTIDLLDRCELNEGLLVLTLQDGIVTVVPVPSCCYSRQSRLDIFRLDAEKKKDDINSIFKPLRYISVYSLSAPQWLFCFYLLFYCNVVYYNEGKKRGAFQ